jgi:hypothetical protein
MPHPHSHTVPQHNLDGTTVIDVRDAKYGVSEVPLHILAHYFMPLHLPQLILNQPLR